MKKLHSKLLDFNSYLHESNKTEQWKKTQRGCNNASVLFITFPPTPKLP